MGRVAVMACLCIMLNNEGTLNSSGSAARKQLPEYIISPTLLQTSIPLLPHGVNQSVMAAIRKLRGIASDPTRYSRED